MEYIFISILHVILIFLFLGVLFEIKIKEQNMDCMVLDYS